MDEIRSSRQEEIHAKGFAFQDADMPPQGALAQMDFKSGLAALENAIIDLSYLRKVNPNLVSKSWVMDKILHQDYKTLREISEAYYNFNGIYRGLCNYYARLFFYDWFVTVDYNEKAVESKLQKDYAAVLSYLDDSQVKRLCGSIALDIMKFGCYYGIVVDQGDKFSIQKLPVEYCRSRYFSGLNPVVELNMKFFDTFSSPQYRLKVLDIFGKDIKKAYIAYKEGKLKGDYPGDGNGWYMISPDVGIKFNFNGSDMPAFIQTIPNLIDLADAQDVDKKKVLQQLLKIIIQKLPIDKNGDLVFDIDEAKDIHNSAVGMLRRSGGYGVDVFTTFADVTVEDLADKNSVTTTDDLERVERTVFNEAAVSQNMFNATGNISLDKSIVRDTATVINLIEQFEAMLNMAIKHFSRNNHYRFRAHILKTTGYNYQDFAKMYKEQTAIGFSKLLPQIAMGHSQSEILQTINFENKILKLSEIMIPPMSSNTMSGKQQEALRNGGSIKSSDSENEGAGRPEKASGDKSEKTIQNRESMGKES